MDDQIDPGDNFFGIDLSDCVTVAANSPSNAHTNPQDASKRPFDQVAGVVAGSSLNVECTTGCFGEGPQAEHPPVHLPSVTNVVGGLTVTPEMRYAGLEVYRSAKDDFEHSDIEAIYRAMAAVAPQPQPIEWTKDPDTGVMTPISIMDSIVGLKAANAHLARRVAELEADKSRRDIVAQNITPATGIPPLGAETWREIAMAYQFETDDLTRQLAVQALAHAEQMEGAQQALKKLRDDIGFWIEAHGEKKLRVAELEAENAKLTLALAAQNIQAQQIAMRVTPATQPTAAIPVTGGSNWGPYSRAVSGAIKDKLLKENPFLRALHAATPPADTPAPERRPDGTLKPVAKAWEAPKRQTDVRRLGG